MSGIFQRISAFFMAMIMSILGLFGIKEVPGFDYEQEPVQQQEEEIEVQGDWLLDGVPSFDAGYYSQSLYNTGTGLFDDTTTRLDTDFEEGDLSSSAVSKASMMQVVRRTTLADSVAYGEKLRSLGYTQTYSHQIENNFYYEFKSPMNSVYYYFNGNTGETRVIDECSSTGSLQTFSYTNSNTSYLADGTPVQPTVYQFSYPYRDDEHVGKNNYGSNGMLYAVSLSDGGLIVIDGGNRWQASEQNVTEFFNFLHSISGTPEEEDLRIALWYGTHAHGDHNAFFYKLLRRYSDRIQLERTVFNFPADSEILKNAYSTRIRSIVATRYPSMQYLKARSGFSFRLQDAFCEVLYAHEDMVAAKPGGRTTDDLNESCCVLKMTIGNSVFLFPGDALRLTASVLLKNFSSQTLHADVVQASHHLLVHLPDLYDVVAPTYVMCPASRLRASTTPYEAYLYFVHKMPEDRLYFAGDGVAYGFTPQADGSITVSQTPTNCGPYDDTPLH